ncbi:MAG: hypothetical protein KatS3mg081_0019 [Gemmatimonadales bacterium]|nr:MAG: hypothetical protein KatS3mg081_0019 [Gemmatimonadales bacterium]
MMLLTCGRRAMSPQRPVWRENSSALLTPGNRVNPLRSLVVVQVVLVAVIGLIAYATTVREAPLLVDVRIQTNWKAYLAVIWNNPLGLEGGVDFVQALDEAGSSQYAQDLTQGGGRVIAPHNLFLSTGVAYGPLAAMGLIVLYGSALLKSRKALLSLVLTGDRIGRFGFCCWFPLMQQSSLTRGFTMPALLWVKCAIGFILESCLGL